MGRGGRVLRAAALIVVAAMLAFFSIGPERFWALAAGPADQGQVDPSRLARRDKPTDSLVCSPGLCAGRTDVLLPLYGQAPEALMRRLDAVVLADARHLTRVDDGSDPAYRRYVARTPMMRFADTIDARASPAAGGTGLMLYGRSQLGVGDWGVNLRRLQAWTAALPP